MRRFFLASFIPWLLACAGALESAIQSQLDDPATREQFIADFKRNMTATCIEGQVREGGDPAIAASTCQCVTDAVSPQIIDNLPDLVRSWGQPTEELTRAVEQAATRCALPKPP